jgi:acetoin utilization deacetylase AcuC-like enzyme
MASRLVALGGEVSAVGPVCTLEGGYDPPLVADAVVATLEGLRGDPVPVPGPPPGADDEVAVGAARNALASHWRGVLG